MARITKKNDEAYIIRSPQLLFYKMKSKIKIRTWQRITKADVTYLRENDELGAALYWIGILLSVVNHFQSVHGVSIGLFVMR